MPTILLVRSKILKISGLLLIFVTVLVAYKRSAMLSFVTSVPVYLYARSVISTSAKFKKLGLVIVGSTLLVLLLVFTFTYISGAIGLDWGARLEAMSADRGSGRLDRYIGYLSLMGSQSIYHWIVGHGYYTTQYTSLGWPHNDFLEVLYDFGLMGMLFYLLFIWQLVKIFFDMKRCKYKHFDAFAVSLVTFLWGSMVTILIVSPYWFLNLAFFWGWVIADFHNAKRYGDPDKIGNPLYTYIYENEYAYEDEYEGYPDLACQD